MWKVILIAILVSILVIALTIASVVTKRREKAIYRKRLLAELKHQADELLDIIELIELLDNNYDAVQQLNKHYIQIVESMQRSDEHINYTTPILQAALDRKKLYMSGSKNADSTNNYSLTQIPKIQNNIYKADKALKLMVKKGKLSATDCTEHCTHLKWLKAKTESDIYFEHGDHAAASNDHNTAITYYTRARDILVQINTVNNRQNDLLKTLKDKIHHHHQLKRNPNYMQSNNTQNNNEPPNPSNLSEEQESVANTSAVTNEYSSPTTSADSTQNNKPILINPHGNKKSIK